MTTDHKNPEAEDVALGAAIRTARRIRNISQTALVEACGVSFQQIQKYENGANRVSFSRLVRISRALGVPVASLMEHIVSEPVQELSPQEKVSTTILASTAMTGLARNLALLPVEERRIVLNTALAMTSEFRMARTGAPLAAKAA